MKKWKKKLVENLRRDFEITFVTFSWHRKAQPVGNNTKRRPIDAPSCYHWTFAITAFSREFVSRELVNFWFLPTVEIRWKVKRSRKRGEKTRSWRDFIELKRFSGRFASQIRFPATVAPFKSKPDIVCWNESLVARVGMQVTRKIFREILSRRLITASLGRSHSNGCDVILEGNHIFLYDIKLFTGLFSSGWWTSDRKM